MNAHTPGPWRVEESTPGDGHRSIVGADGSLVVAPDDGWNSGYLDYETRLANAHLIAAAPDLLEALQDLLDLISFDELIPESVSYMQQARAAIAKAEGTK